MQLTETQLATMPDEQLLDLCRHGEPLLTELARRYEDALELIEAYEAAGEEDE